MSTKLKTYGIMIIAAVMLVAMAFAGAASADYPVPQSVENPSVDVVYDNGTHHVEVVSGTAYLISTEDDWRHVVANSSMWDKTLVLTNDITFTDSVGSIGNSGTKFSGSIYGNGSKFVNFTQSGNTAYGLINYATEGCVLNNVHMYNCNINSGINCVGGLVGCAYAATSNGVRLCGCLVTYSNVTSSSNDVGGLVGNVKNAKIWVNASGVDHVYVSSSGNLNVGGLVGCASDAITVCVNNSRVERCEIYADGGYAGGLVGLAGSDRTFRNTSVRDCKIWSGSSSAVGGLFGSAYSPTTVNGCIVENCTMMSGNDCVGGLAGQAFTGISFDGVTSWVNYTWVKGSSNIGSLIGYTFSSLTSPAVGHYMVCNCTGVSYTSVTGVDNSFNGTYSDAATAFVDGIGSHIGQDMIVGKHYGYGSAPKTVTYDANGATSGIVPEKKAYVSGSIVTVADKGNLVKTGCVFAGWNTKADGTGTSYQPSEKFTIFGDITLYATWVTSYNITITNVTGSYELTSALTTVYGDDPATDGAAVLTFENSKPVLTLNSFKASNTTGNVPIINASVANLTIELNGESNLTGSYAGSEKGLLLSSGNLTITTTNGGKLFVNNTNTSTSSSVSVSSIMVKKNLTIEDGATITAIASTSKNGQAITINSHDYLVIKDSSVTAKAIGGHDFVEALVATTIVVSGENTIIDATAISNNNSVAYPFFGIESISITSAKKITAIGSSAYGNASSFAYDVKGGRDFSGLTSGYTFSNATNPGSAPTSYAVFNNSNNWHIGYDGESWDDMVSNFSAVTIQKSTTPTPSPSSSGSSKHSGYTQILSQGQVAPTPYATTTPTVAPTAKPTTVVNPTAKATTQATTQPTQSSPAPVAGIIAGLGAAALVLARMRR